jgi:hypothetical protein
MLGIDVASKKATLYVKSVKTIETEEKVVEKATIDLIWRGYPYTVPPRFLPCYDVVTVSKDEFVLPEDQQRVVEMVKEIASRHGLEVEVIDVSRENALHRAVQRELENIKTFPTLIANSGEKLEGNFSQEQIESSLSES